jgi:hypothetical protein
MSAHHHYSPFQFATGVQVADDDVSVKKVLKTLKKLTRKDAAKARAIPTTMTREEAHMIPGSPNAFISPNGVDQMRTIHSVFGNC